MRIPYLNTPCLINETCFHGQCLHIEDYLLGWYEYCLCYRSYSGLQCNEQTSFNRIDQYLVLTCLITCCSIIICLFCIPYFYHLFKEDFYPQIIECKRLKPYIECQTRLINDLRIYRVPSEYLIERRTIIDGLIPLHRISSLAYRTVVV